jgi:hypothetical protein
LKRGFAFQSLRLGLPRNSLTEWHCPAQGSFHDITQLIEFQLTLRQLVIGLYEESPDPDRSTLLLTRYPLLWRLVENRPLVSICRIPALTHLSLDLRRGSLPWQPNERSWCRSLRTLALYCIHAPLCVAVLSTPSAFPTLHCTVATTVGKGLFRRTRLDHSVSISHRAAIV